MNEKIRTIKVSLENYEKLARMGTMKDSFDSVIGRLLGTYNNQKQQDLGKGNQHQALESRKIQT
jgi:predicted CopG family antitoxin